MIPMTDLLDKIRERINRRNEPENDEQHTTVGDYVANEPPHPHFDDWLTEVAGEDFDNYFEDGDEGKPDTLVVTGDGIKER